MKFSTLILATFFVSTFALSDTPPAPKVSCFLTWQLKNDDGTTKDFKESERTAVPANKETTFDLKGFGAKVKLVTDGALNATGRSVGGPPRWWTLDIAVTHEDTTAFRKDKTASNVRQSLGLAEDKESALINCDPI